MQHGWFGTVEQFGRQSQDEWLSSLKEHYQRVTHEGVSGSQVDAWRSCFHILQEQMRRLIAQRPESRRWWLVFEYELPREGGRRPDVILLAEDAVLVLEFKEKAGPERGDLDQVSAYARDLLHYHKASHDRRVIPLLVPTKSTSPAGQAGDVLVVPPRAVADEASRLVPSRAPNPVDPHAWVSAAYEPLPFLVQAAVSIFRNEPLPYIRRAHAEAQIPQVIEYLFTVAEQAKQQRERHLILVTGVPGSGKTLVGLQFVHEYTHKTGSSTAQAVFLSGNGPLVEVLQHALRNRTFVQPMRNFIREYGIAGRGIPPERILAFDEAQRAWGADHVLTKHGRQASEPDMLVEVSERTPDWSVLIALVGEGQEIHIGEEEGLGQWNAALTRGRFPWHVHTPPILKRHFTGAHALYVNELLSLETSIRMHQATFVQQWINYLLQGEIDLAAVLADRTQSEGYAMYVTRSLDDAKQYVRDRYDGQPIKRFGLVASSKPSRSILDDLGARRDYNSTKLLRVGPWYNDPPSSPQSCCNLDRVVTEFQCQGLELDLPILCWSNDLLWQEHTWNSPVRGTAKDPFALRVNSYRVLLSRGRDGVVIWVPPDPSLNGTYEVLLRAGIKRLEHGMVEHAPVKASI